MKHIRQKSSLLVVASLALFLSACSVSSPNAAAGSGISSFPVVTSTEVPTVTPTPTAVVPLVILPPIVTPTLTPTPPRPTLPPVTKGIWISAEELAALPMSGGAWERLKETADGQIDDANLAGYTANDDVQTLAVALVYARTGDAAYQKKAADAIRAAMGTEYSGRVKGPNSAQGALAVTLSRNLVSYIIAADLVGLSEYDPRFDARFRSWLVDLRDTEWADDSIVANDEQRVNNHGRMAGASRAAIAVYLDDEVELEQTARVFRGFLGDRSTYAGFKYARDLSWQADPDAPVGINPLGAVKDGYVIDGALPEEMRRGCSFQIPPCYSNYPWEGLQGILVEAVILRRQGYDVWSWEDQAILRAVQFLYDLQRAYPEEEWWAPGDDRWIPWLVNAVYGTDFPTEPVTRPGKNMGWTDWTHARPLAGLP